MFLKKNQDHDRENIQWNFQLGTAVKEQYSKGNKKKEKSLSGYSWVWSIHSGL